MDFFFRVIHHKEVQFIAK